MTGCLSEGSNPILKELRGALGYSNRETGSERLTAKRFNLAEPTGGAMA